MSDKKMKLNISTPNKDFFSDDVDMVIVKTTSGDLGILPSHVPLVTVLDIGVVTIKKKGEEKKATLNMGFLQVANNQVQILTDSAEWPDEINLERAREAKRRAEERLNSKDEVDVIRAELALRRAINRISFKERV